ncbi:hypothetical protein [Candidatus Magnetobacterium casense]|uniref:Holin n=1 Tax=Candidatus Magnetobacterium casense TaxID=1455061 RepID=A0ABS6RXV7_9BACT|nr:hypothetical protein [Candidatus Magnetobacterium casensis]MBV6341078.1 hypothetical protein [Candidatus Magnetobacterium casensis]
MPIFGIFSFMSAPVEWAGLGLIGIAIGWLANKYLKPWLNTEIRLKVARYVLLMADEITDQLMVKYPDKKLVEVLDEAVDTLMKVCGVSKEVAERAIKAAIARKG